MRALRYTYFRKSRAINAFATLMPEKVNVWHLRQIGANREAVVKRCVA
jgi:hypothetical protein